MENAAVTKTDDASMNLAPFENLIRDRSGLSFKKDIIANLEEAVRERMTLKQYETSSEYFTHLLQDEPEIDHLIYQLTINETYFMREPAHFGLLARHLVPHLMKSLGGAKERISILSAGCATGAEPYSIVIALVEKLGPEILGNIRVLGVDIDPGALETARAGVFGKHAFRGVDPAIREKYFCQTAPARFALKDFIKHRVEFQALNLAGTYPPDLKNIDIIFYRNVSFYFERDTQRRILQRLAGILDADGYLIKSTVETTLHHTPSLYLAERDGVYFFSRKFSIPMNHSAATAARARPTAVKKRPRPAPVRAAGRGKTPQRPLPAPPAKTPARQYEDALGHIRRDQLEEALKTLNDLLEKDVSFTRAYSLKAEILINLQRLAEAEQFCAALLALDEWNLQSHLLLGIIAVLRGNREESRKHFKHALYVEPSCWLAHYYLAEIHYALENFQKARQEYGVTLKLLEQNGIEQYGLAYFPLSFSVSELIHLCRHNRDRLKTRVG